MDVGARSRDGFSEKLRAEANFMEAMGRGEVPSAGQALVCFLELAELLPRLRQLETNSGDLVRLPADR